MLEIVIIGSGYAGVETFKELDKKHLSNVKITLLSKTNYFYHNVASPRAICDINLAEDICLRLDKIIKGENRQFIHGSVVSIDPATNQLNYTKQDSNENLSIKFDYLVFGLGSSYVSPFHSSEYERAKQIDLIKEFNSKIERSNSILIVGGGAVGAELAGEFKTDFPDKKITLLSNSNRLVSAMSESFSAKVLSVLNRRKVDVIFNDKINLQNIENFKANKIKTANGKEIEFDAYFICTGSKPCTDLLKNCMPTCLNSDGYIKVTDTFQLVNNPNMFALGDCCDSGDAKLAYKAGAQAPTVAFNIEQLIKKNENKLKKYSVSTTPIMILSIGRSDGVAQFGSMSFGGCIPTMLKSKNLFVSKYKKDMGY
jgi:NADH dehydrogenase FAD-containing subunit